MQLIYRGHAFTYSPASVPATVGTAGAIQTLFYRGSTYQCQFATLRSARLPNAINWRFAGVSERLQPSLKPAH